MYRVFLVDDEEITLTQTAEKVPWLDNGFIVVGMESDPVQAVRRIVEENPEVVFCDLRMPQMDGHELMHRVQEEGVHPEFVMLSAYGNFDDARKFFRQEGFDYLLKPMRMQEMEILLEKLSRRLAEKYPAQPLEDTDESEQGTIGTFDDLVAYVSKNFAHNHTLDQLGRQFGFSTSYICSLFARKFNTSLTGFVTRLRMEEAHKRIRESGEPMKNIASDCGYKDYYYFSRVFKGYYGISPTELKEEGTDEGGDVC